MKFLLGFVIIILSLSLNANDSKLCSINDGEKYRVSPSCGQSTGEKIANISEAYCISAPLNFRKRSPVQIKANQLKKYKDSFTSNWTDNETLRGLNFDNIKMKCDYLITLKQKNDYVVCSNKSTKNGREKCFNNNGLYINNFVSLRVAEMLNIQNNKFITLKASNKTENENEETTYITEVNQNKKTIKTDTNLNPSSQIVTQVLSKDKIKEELKYYKELFDEELIEKSEYDELRKALLAGIKEGSVTKTIIMNKPQDVFINSQSDITKLEEQLKLEQRKVKAMEDQAAATKNNNAIIKKQQSNKAWGAIMGLGLNMMTGNIGPGSNQRQTNCYGTGSGFNCTSYDW